MFKRYVLVSCLILCMALFTGCGEKEELAVFKRGRNAQVRSIPAHASRAQYGEATALEALLGWLYLLGRQERINELFIKMMEE